MHKLKKLQHTRSYHKLHNAAYAIYYGFALIEDRGAKLIVVSFLFACVTLATILGEDA